MELKSMISSILAGFLFLINSQQVINAEETPTSIDDKQIEEALISGVADLEIQLDELYKEVGTELNINYIYVKILHLIAGGKAVYADKRPNIYSEETTNEAFSIEGVEQDYSKLAPWAYCPDTKVSRPSGKYLPDAAYSVTYDIVQLMNERYYTDRGNIQSYFNNLKVESQTTIIFCEALLQYLGAGKYEVDGFYRAYEQILYTKEANENVLEADGKGGFRFKDEYKNILRNNGITDNSRIKALEIALSFDSMLASAKGADELSQEYTLPYKVGYTSRENMMKAAMSIVGKVRYVWGGGHLKTGTIRGINPIWEEFDEAYENQNGDRDCIRPAYSWCPLHGVIEDGNGCLFKSTTVYSIEQYLEERKGSLDIELIKDDGRFEHLLNRYIDFERGVAGHRLDGLDCSGYTSWVFNQIDETRNYDSSAERFTSQSSIVGLDAEKTLLLPGDVYAWTGHIVLNVGKVSDSDNVYVILEASPNIVKFGVMYRDRANMQEVNEAINIAKEANQLLGGIDTDTEYTHVYNMDKVGYVETEESETDEENTETNDENTETSENEVGRRYAEVGRFKNMFIDEDTIIEEHGKTIKQFTAQEIIQHVINSYGREYLTGIDTYTGKIFSVAGMINTSEEETNNNEKKENRPIETKKLVIGG